MLVLGNGESRQHINIDKIEGVKVGCNAILRDYRVDHLVCVDRKMVREAIDSGYNEHSLIYTRSDWYKQFSDIKHIRIVPELPEAGYEKQDDPFHWGSGPYAVLLGAQLAEGEFIQLLGFDLYGLKDGKINNLYKDTDNYNASFKKAVDPRFWVYQIGKVFEWFPTTNFQIFCEQGWALPKEWKKPNVVLDNIDDIL